MRTITPLRLVTLAGATALTLGLLAGCASSGVMTDSYAPSGGGSSSDSSADWASEEGSDPQSAPSSVINDRALVTTGTMGIQTPDVAGSTDAVEAIIESLGGRIDSRTESSRATVRTELTIRVPADDYETLIEQLREVGDVEYVNTDVVDVTMETVDLEARIQSLEASVQSLRNMLEQATTVEDMLDVEATLSEREADLQSLKAQQAALADQVAMSTLHLTIANNELTNPTPDDQGGFLGGLLSGWNALVVFFNGLLTVIGFLLPGFIVLVILGIIAFAIVRAIVRSNDRKRVLRAQAAPAMAGVPDARGSADAHVASADAHVAAAPAYRPDDAAAANQPSEQPKQGERPGADDARPTNPAHPEQARPSAPAQQSQRAQQPEKAQPQQPQQPGAGDAQSDPGAGHTGTDSDREAGGPDRA